MPSKYLFLDIFVLISVCWFHDFFPAWPSKRSVSSDGVANDDEKSVSFFRFIEINVYLYCNLPWYFPRRIFDHTFQFSLLVELFWFLQTFDFLRLLSFQGFWVIMDGFRFKIDQFSRLRMSALFGSLQYRRNNFSIGKSYRLRSTRYNWCLDSFRFKTCNLIFRIR